MSSQEDCRSSKMDFKDNMDDSESVISDESEEEFDIDEEETEKRRAEYLTSLKEVESHYMKLKDELIQSKLDLIDKKLMEIENDTARDYTVPLTKLKETKDMKIDIATRMKDYRMKNIENIWECEKKAARMTYENDKHQVVDNMRAKIESEIKALEEKARNYFIQIKKYEDIEETIQNAQQWNLNGNTGHKGNFVSTSSDDMDRKKKVLNADDPYIVYCLSEFDILEDLSLLSKSLETATVNANAVN